MNTVSMYFSGKVLFKAIITRPNISKRNNLFPLLKTEVGGKKISKVTSIQIEANNPAGALLFYVLGEYDTKEGKFLELEGEGVIVNGKNVVYTY